jgi:hypothetical protein
MTKRGQNALNISIIFTSLATFIVAVRVYARGFLVKQIGADDITIIISLVITKMQFVSNKDF